MGRGGQKNRLRVTKREMVKKLLKKIKLTLGLYVPIVYATPMVIGDYLEDGVISGVFMGFPYAIFLIGGFHSI